MASYRKYQLKLEDNLREHLHTFRGTTYNYAILYAPSKVFDEQRNECYLVCETRFCFPSDPKIIKRHYIPYREFYNFLDDFSDKINDRPFILSRVEKTNDLEDYPFLYLLE